MSEINYKKRNAELVAMLTAILNGQIHTSILTHRNWIERLIKNNTEEYPKIEVKQEDKISNSLVGKG